MQRTIQSVDVSRRSAAGGPSNHGRIHRARGVVRPPVYTVVGLSALVLGALVLHIWHADPRIPFYYGNGGDNYFSYYFSKWFVDHSSIYDFNSRLAAPIGMNLGDWPQISFLHFVIQRLLAIATGDGGVALNVYYLAFFPLSAITAMFAMRRFGLPPVAAFAPAVLFALLPYRFARNEAHLYYASYWLVPLTVLAAVIIARGDPLWRTTSGRIRIVPTKRGWFLIIAAVATGCDNQYHAFFAIYFVFVAVLLATVRTRSWKPAVAGMVLSVLLLGTVGAQMIPTFVYHQSHGQNGAAYSRVPADAQLYGLQVVQLLLPVIDHRVHALAAKRAYFDSHSIYNNENGSVTLGAVGSVGFLTLIGVMLSLGRRAFARDLQTLAIFNVFAVLFATVGGFGTFINFFVRPEIRAYNRIAPFIGFFALTAVAYGLAWLIRTRCKSIGRRSVWAAIVAVTLVGTLEQTTNADVPPYAASRALFASDAAFGKAVDAALPAGAAVFELPVFPFPEGVPIGQLLLSSEFRPYLHTRATRWSFGAVKGRAPGTWDQYVGALQGRDFIVALVQGGFQGVCVFRNGYADRGQALETSLASIVGPARIVSPDQSMAFYSLEPLYRSARSADARIGTSGFIENSVERNQLDWGEGFYPQESANGSFWHWALNTATLVVDNEHAERDHYRFKAFAQMAAAPADLTVRSAGRVIAHFAVAHNTRTPISFDFVAPLGQSQLTFSTSAAPLVSADARTLVFALFDDDVDFPQLQDSRAVRKIVGEASVAAGSLEAVALGAPAGLNVYLVRGCSGLETLGPQRWHWCGHDVELGVASSQKRAVRITALASTPGKPNAPIQVQGTGGWRLLRGTGKGGVQISETVAVGPGHPARLLIRTTAAALKVPTDSRDLVLRLDDLRVTNTQ